MANVFNSEGPFAATRNLLIFGQQYRAGDLIDLTGLSVHRLKQMVSNRLIVEVKPDIASEATTKPVEPLSPVEANPIEDAPVTASEVKRLRMKRVQ